MFPRMFARMFFSQPTYYLFVLFFSRGVSLRLSRSSRMCHAPLVTTCPLKQEEGGPVSRMMHGHRLPSLPAEQSGITKQSGRPLSHTLTMSLCPLSLCITVFLLLSFGPLSLHLLPLCPSMRLHAMFNCLFELMLLCFSL